MDAPARRPRSALALALAVGEPCPLALRTVLIDKRLAFMKTLRQLHDIEGKRVLLRVDFNVPVRGGKVTDDNRIVESLETIRYLLDHQARLVIISHLGRPEGRRNPEYSLRPSVKRLRDMLLARKVKTPVRFCPETIGRQASAAVEATKPGEAVVLENLRFDAREEQNDSEFSEELAKLGDVFVNDAFGVLHRAHASTVGVAGLLPSFAGLLVEKEVKNLENLRDRPEHPFVVILGGAKPDDKIALIQSLQENVGHFLIAGGIANTFLKAQGMDIKESLVGNDKALAVAKKLLSELAGKLVVPVDFIWDGNSIKDVGDETIDHFEKHILKAKTIFWNGTLGVAEDTRFAKGTRAIAVAIAASGAKSVVGGGDTVAAVDRYKLRKHISFVSTGGGATLEFLAGKSLPGLEVLGYKTST